MIDKIPPIDAVYWNRLKKGDPQALGYFYDKYVDRLFMAAMRITDNRDLAKDTIQEVFIELWNYRNTLGDIIHSYSYLIKVMRSILFKKLKKELRIKRLPLDESLMFSEQSIEDIIISADIDKEKKSRLHRALSNLTSRQKLVLEMRFYQGLSYDQIADKLSMNYQSVNNLAFRTILRLRNQLHIFLVVAYMVVSF
jgi:RNA polymerase sigma factor (sigma-70 family)